MKKKRVLNTKGFVLAETLVVAVSVSAIFTIMYLNFYPLMGEYQRRENFDDIDSKYGTYWLKKMVQSKNYNFSNVDNEINNKGYSQFSCDNLNDKNKINMCKQTIINLEVSCDNENTDNKIESCENQISNSPHIYITRFTMVKKNNVGGVEYDLKNKMANNNLPEGVKDYLKYLPDYSKVTSPNNAQYRIIVEYYRHRFDTDKDSSDPNSYIVDDDNDFKTYSTIEVKR